HDDRGRRQPGPAQGRPLRPDRGRHEAGAGTRPAPTADWARPCSLPAILIWMYGGRRCPHPLADKGMSSTLPASEPQPTQASARVTNDFSIQVATVNGSGSQTANLVLLRAIFQMGVPVSGKNLFPSNIAGLPTWYTIRANHRGYVSRKKEIDFLVAMNPETARDDVMALEPGRAVVYDAPLRLDTLRSDLIFYAVPFDKIVAEVCTEAKLRRLVKNMIYDGI